VNADLASARTWLLGATALWALLFWVLGLAGFGGRIERLPEDPALLQALPEAPNAAEERLGPLTQYTAVGERPVFTDNRRPQPFFINGGEGEEQNTFDYVLTSVIVSPGLRLAILHPTGGGEPVRLKVGESPDGAPAWSLLSINPRSAEFAGPEGTQVIELRVFDGTGGEPPTAVAMPRLDSPMPGQQPGAAQAGVVRPGSSGGPGSPGGRPAGATEAPASAVPGGTAAPASDKGRPGGATAAQPPTPQPSAPLTAEAQVEAIRQRIEARRAQLRRQAQQPPSPTPAPAPDERN
jgi:general secretion pathway protein N